MKTKIANGLFIFLLIICVIMLSFLAYRKFNPPKTVIKEKKDRETPVVRAIWKASPAVVNLQTNSILPGMKDTSVAGTGSIIDSSGLILTNYHIVKKSEVVNVTLSTGVTCKARVIVTDPVNDIALLKLKNPQIGLPVIPLMRPWKLMLGETVIAVGNPYGLDGTITVGILSGVNRSVADGVRVLFNDLLQTDAAVFPGNSGGPLINLEGCMIGMNMAIKRNAPGISFAVPLYRVENILAKYLLPERMLNMMFGFQPAVEADGRIVVKRVFPGSPAHLAGVRSGMEITSFQGWNPKYDLLGLCRRMIRLKPGEPVKMKLKTIGKVILTPVPFEQYPAIVPIYWKLGIHAVDLDPRKASFLRYPLQEGVVVTGFDRSGKYMFRRGDIIVGWNKKKIRNMEDLKKEVQNAQIGSRAFVTVYSFVNDPKKGPFLMKHIYPVFIR